MTTPFATVAFDDGDAVLYFGGVEVFGGKAHAEPLLGHIAAVLNEARATSELHRAAAEKAMRDRDEARAENAAWRKATGRDDADVLDFNLGRSGIDTHLEVLVKMRDDANARANAAEAKVASMRRELAAFKVERALGGVKVLADGPEAVHAELVRLCNEARDVANRNKEIADARQSLLQKAEAKVARLEAILSRLLVWADHVAPRVGVRMSDPNTGARVEARAALSETAP